MGKNNKSRRATKKNTRIYKRMAAKKKKLAPGNLPVGPEFRIISNPFARLSQEERIQVMREMVQNSETKYQNALGKIVEILHRYDPIAMLAILSSYGLMVGVGDDGLLEKDSERTFHQSHVEICQALALQINPEKLEFQPFASDTVTEMWEALTNLLSMIHFRSVSDLSDSSGKEVAVCILQQMIRGNTRFVRNWGFFSQVKNISHELYGFFDDLLANEYGFTSSNVIALFELLIDEIEIATTRRHHSLRDLYKVMDKKQLVFKFFKLFRFSSDNAAEFTEKYDVQSVDHKALFFMLLSFMDLQLHKDYEFSRNDLASKLGIGEEVVRKIFDQFSYNFGDLASYKREDIYLANPIWLSPAIKTEDGKYFCVLPQVFFSFIIPSLDGLIEKVDKKALSKRRASYLEEKIVEIVKRRFPEATTVSGIKWKLDNAEYETDLITFIDSHAVIVEAKSGNVSEPALRGAPDRLKKHIDEILVSPNLQSRRFKGRLEELIVHPEIEDELRTKLPVDLNHIHKIIRVSVSLEGIGSIHANIAQLRETGWLPDDFEPCPTMTLADFETLFDFLEHPVQILHYLEARQELENSVEYMGDELDLMGLYTNTLFSVGDIEKGVKVFVSGFSSPIDAYYNAKDAGVNIPKPQPKISPLFSGIMGQLEKQHSHRWTEIGVILNRFSPDDQRNLAKMVEVLKKNVRKNWMIDGHENMAICIPPKASRYAIVYVMFNDNTASRRDEFIRGAASTAFKSEHVQQCLVIAKNIDKDDLSYHFIGLFKSPSYDQLLCMERSRGNGVS